ncbi:ferrous iron transport protein A [Larkinella ripae]
MVTRREGRRSVADLKTGEKAVIQSFTDPWMSLKLLEMGCLPGTEVSLHCKAPLGDPICLNVSGYCLSMRKSEAATILIDSH